MPTRMVLYQKESDTVAFQENMDTPHKSLNAKKEKEQEREKERGFVV